ncbi:MAG: flagellar basal body-associated FliL family protein [Piscinibacter sp.]|nr:flagellar basal body-associated FliL family protein [Piscinibacter sp.]
MSSAAAPAATDAAGDTPAPARGKKKLIIIIAAALLVLLLGGGGAAVYVMKKRAAAAEAGEDGAAPAEAHADEARVPPIFVPLEPFVVNLADKDSERYAQIGLTLEVDDPKFAEEMKLYMPAIRNAILMILAHKQAAELLERSGKQALAEEIMREAVRPMGIEIDAVERAPAPAATQAAASAADEEAANAPPAPPPRPAIHNPVRRVHFASFIVQ